MSEAIMVSKAKFKEIGEKYAALKISDGRNCETFRHKKTYYVCTGGAGKGDATGWHYWNAYKVVSISNYSAHENNELKALRYSEHWRAVDAGKRARCYNGMQITANGRQLVLIGEEITFKSANDGEQTELFK